MQDSFAGKKARIERVKLDSALISCQRFLIALLFEQRLALFKPGSRIR